MTGNTTGVSTRQHLHIVLPVLLVDDILPTLKDTELRVLLIVLRQTHVAGKEAERCWLTHRELCRRTGRASEAVSGAVEKLVDKGLLHVMDEAGKRLHTTRERQQMMGRHFYRLAHFDNRTDERNEVRNVEVVATVGKAKTIEDINKPYSFRKTETPYISPSIPLSMDEKERIEQEKAHIRERLREISR